MRPPADLTTRHNQFKLKLISIAVCTTSIPRIVGYHANAMWRAITVANGWWLCWLTLNYPSPSVDATHGMSIQATHTVALRVESRFAFVLCSFTYLFTTLCRRKTPPPYILNNGEKWTNSNNFRYAESWGNFTSENCKIAHLTWILSPHYLVTHLTLLAG